jgi:cytochrome d ubiquinol oxidase subunit II
MAYVPVALMLAGMAAYTVLAGADFGAGLWTLLASGPGAARTRAEARHAMGPVWEANHVWLIFVLVICWTGYPVAFGSIASTLALPLTMAAVGIIFRGAAYALRGQGESRVAENLFALSSVATPFALGTITGAIATGRVPVGNAAGNLVTSWLNPASIVIGVLAVAFSGYLAAVFLAADSRRHPNQAQAAVLTAYFRRRALAAGVACGALALAGLLVMRHFGLDLTRGLALAMVCVSAVAGLATMALCWRSRFGLARLSAALAVAAVVAGWAAAQAPRMLPGMTITQAAAGSATLVALTVAVACGAVFLIPSLALLYALLLRGRLDAPEGSGVGGAAAVENDNGAGGAGAVVEGGSGAGGAEVVNAAAAVKEDSSSEGTDEAAATGVVEEGDGADEANNEGPGTISVASPGSRPAPSRVPAALAAGGLIAGAGLLVFTDMGWMHALGVACLIMCAVSVFRLATGADAG